MAGTPSLPIAESLTTIHLGRLLADDTTESAKLLEACQTQGFFYLDLSSDAKLCAQWKDMLEVMKEYFNQPLHIKMRDAKGSDNHGYEPVGTEEGPEPDTKDGYESLKISRRELLQGSTDLTSSVRAETELFFSFMERAHEITLVILSRLSSQLGLGGPRRFESYHADPGPSLSTLGLLRYPKRNESIPTTSIGHNKHTDVGSLTFLLAAQWGLQYLSPDTRRWECIEPRTNHAIINVGDSLRFPSEGQLASVVHRVVPLREKPNEDRYSIAYFLRLNDDVGFYDTMGTRWTAKEWHDFKFDVFKSPSTLDKKDQFLTGGMVNWDHHSLGEGKKIAMRI